VARAESQPYPWDLRLLTGAFLVSGTVHLVAPRVFLPLVPRWLPARRGIVRWSGAAELVCAAGLLVPATRRPAGLASAALLVAVFPGNVQMAVDARPRGPAYRAATVLRLPLQVPLVRSALRVAGGGR
jgi:uncharacterized membrane protein